VLVVIGVGGYFGYHMLFPSDSSSRVATSDVPPSTAPIPAPEPPKEAVPTPQPPAQEAASVKSTPVPSPDPGAKSVSKDATTTAGSSTGSTKAPDAAAPKMDSGKAPSTKATNPPGAPGSSSSTADTTGTMAQGRPSPPQTAQPDRWQLMKEAMARCAGDNFFKRVACEQGVGLQYCEGYWGKVPQCPSGPAAKDRGQ
jgi:hypothetical protein